jgi:hypothetical protein
VSKAKPWRFAGALEAQEASRAPAKLTDQTPYEPDTISPELNVMLVEDHKPVQRRVRNARARYQGAERWAFDKALWDVVAKHEKNKPRHARRERAA